MNYCSIPLKQWQVRHKQLVNVLAKLELRQSIYYQLFVMSLDSSLKKYDKPHLLPRGRTRSRKAFTAAA